MLSISLIGTQQCWNEGNQNERIRKSDWLIKKENNKIEKAQNRAKTDEKITSVLKLYNLVVNNIKKLANIGINLTVTTTVMKNNIGNISKIQEFADFLDLDFEKAPIF